MRNLLSQPHLILSVENGLHGSAGSKNITHEKALHSLHHAGGQKGNVHSVAGHYGSPENSILITNPTDQQKKLAGKLAYSTGQEAILSSDGLSHKLHYIHGPNKGKTVHGRGTIFHEQKPSDFYTTLPSGEHFTHNLDFNKSENDDRSYYAKAKDGLAVLAPVRFKEHGNLMADILHHITIKAFNKDKEKKEDLIGRLNGMNLPTADVNALKIEATELVSPTGQVHKILSVYGLPKEYSDAYEKLRDIGFTHGEYLPHIKVGDEIWNKVKNGATAQGLGMTVEPPAFFEGGIPIHKFGEPEQLKKAPLEYESGYANAHAKEAPDHYSAPEYVHIKTNRLPNGLYHHIFHNYEDSDTVHHITNSDQPKQGTVFAEIAGESDDESAPINVNNAQVHPGHKGKGLGKLAYKAALAHHGKMYSDELVSVKADKAWHQLQDEGAKVTFGKPDTRQKHVAEATPAIREKLTASESSMSSLESLFKDEAGRARQLGAMVGNAPEHQAAIDFASKMPNVNWGTWFMRNYKRDPRKTMLPENLANIQHHIDMSSAHPKHYKGIVFDKTHDLDSGFGKFKEAESKVTDALQQKDSGKKSIDSARMVDPKGTKVLDLGNNWGWYDLQAPSCTEEARAMGHCGSGGLSTLLSLRKEHKFGDKTKHEPFVTASMSEDGQLQQIKARGNKKPEPIFHAAILNLLHHPSIKSMDMEGGHDPSSDFQLEDLEPEQLDQLLEKKPGISRFYMNSKDTKSLYDPKFVRDNARQIVSVRNIHRLLPEEDVARLHGQLAGHSDSEVVQNLAENPNLHPSVQEKLAGHSDPTVAYNLARNPNLPPSVQEKLAGHSDLGIVAYSLAHNPNLHPSVQERLAGHSDSKVVQNLARNPNLHPSVQERLNANKVNKADSDSTDLEKSRPRVTFPKLPKTPTRPDQDVQLLESPKQIKMFSRKTAAPIRDSSTYGEYTITSPRQSDRNKRAKYIESKLTTDRAKETATAGLMFPTDYGPKSGTIAGKMRSKFENYTTPEYKEKLKAHKEKERSALLDYNKKVDAFNEKSKQLRATYDAAPTDEEKDGILNQYRQHRDTNLPVYKKPRLPPIPLIETKHLPRKEIESRGRNVDATVEHEAFHATMQHIKDNYGPKAAHLAEGHLLKGFDPNSLADVGMFIASQYKYDIKSPLFREEMLAHTRDILVNPEKRKSFKYYLIKSKTKGSRKLSDLKAGLDYANGVIKALKQGHQKAYKIAQNLTPEMLGIKSTEKLAASEPMAKAPIAYHGSPVAFDEHERPKKDKESHLNYGPGIYYATDPSDASGYAQPQIARNKDHSNAWASLISTPEYQAHRDSLVHKYGLKNSVDVSHRNYRKFADELTDYDNQKVSQKLGLSPNVRRSDVQVKNPFDPYNRKHAEKVAHILGISPAFLNSYDNLYHRLSSNDVFDGQKWGERSHKLNRAIKAAGFDGIHDKKIGHIVAFSPKQIKPAFGKAEAGSTPQQTSVEAEKKKAETAKMWKQINKYFPNKPVQRPKKLGKFENNDKIPGGLADNKKPSDFNPKSIKQGIKVELEHTSDKSMAREIASDHLTEDKDYYKKLKEMEKSDYYGRGLPMGWISPQGEFHEMGSKEDHHEAIGDLTGVHPHDEDDYDTSKEWAYNQGWISVGHSGEFNFQGHKNVLANRNHPAMKTMRALAHSVAEQYPDEEHIEAYSYDPSGGPSSKMVETNHFLKHGTVRSAIGKSEALAKGPPRSPRKGHTIAQLKRLKADNWHNPDTGTELQPDEAEHHLMQLQDRAADKKVKEMISNQGKPKTTKKPENPGDWF